MFGPLNDAKIVSKMIASAGTSEIVFGKFSHCG
jgi:hypothetical protein